MIIRRSLKDYIKDSQAHDMNPEEYRDALNDVFCMSAQTGTLTIDDIYHNPPEREHTSKRKAYGDITWIEYWRRLTGFKGNHLKCSFCGADIFLDVDSSDALNVRMENPKTSKEAFQAQGGHYHMKRRDNSEGYIIIPVCRECNARSEDFNLVVSEQNEFVEEIGASISEEE